MLGTIRKFSSSIYAKIFLFIVAIPFVFWGMGPVFQGGKTNTILEIGNNKITTEEFIKFIQHNSLQNEDLNRNFIEKKLSDFITNELTKLEIENYNIKLSDNSLSKIIKNQKIFKKNDKFSRTEYEKFLIKNSFSAVAFEANISKQAKTEQFLDFIGGGVIPSKFLINSAYDRVNQKRNIEVINLNESLKKKI